MIDLILAFVAGAVIAWRLAEALHQHSFHKILEELGVTEQQMRDLARKNGIELPDETPQQQPAAEHEIVIEQHGSELYAFKTDGEFIGQGRDKEALIARIAERFKNVRFTVKEGQELLQKNNA